MPELTKEQIALQNAVRDALGEHVERLHQQGIVCLVLAQRGDNSVIVTRMTRRSTERFLLGGLQKLMDQTVEVPLDGD